MKKFWQQNTDSDGLGCLPNQRLSHSDVLLMLRAPVYAARKTVGLLGIKYSIRMKHCKKMLSVCVCVYLLMACGDKYHRGMRVPPA